MGDDLKLKLVGDNHISSLVVYGFGWGGNLEIIGDGSLTINENKTSSAAIAFMAEGTQGSLKVGSEATVTAYKMPDAPLIRHSLSQQRLNLSRSQEILKQSLL